MLNHTPSPRPIPLRRRGDNRFRTALRGGGVVGFLVIVVVLAATWFFGPRIGAPLVVVWAVVAKVPWRDLGFRRPKSWLLLVAGGIVAGVASKLLMKAVVMPLLHAPDINPAFQWLVGNTNALPGVIAMVIFSAGLGEELIARGFLFERLGKLYGESRNALIATILITSTLFGAAHYPEQHWMGVQQAFILALVDGVIFAATRQLWFLIVMHAAFDLVACFIIYFGWERAIAHVFF